MTLTQLFIRFLKQENLYVNFIKSYDLSNYCFYNGVLDNIALNFNTFVDYDGGKISNIFSFLSEKDVKKWKKFWKKNKFDVVTIEVYSNLATKVLKKFANQHNIEKEICEVLFKNGRIEKNIIQDNDIDKILRENKVAIGRLFQYKRTFATWVDYDYLIEEKELTWEKINQEWLIFLVNNNINGVLIV